MTQVCNKFAATIHGSEQAKEKNILEEDWLHQDKSFLFLFFIILGIEPKASAL